MIPLSQAANTLGISQASLRQQIAAGRFSAVKLGPIWVTTQEEIDRYAREQLGRKGRKTLSSG